MKSTVSIVGVGNMGGGMATHLLEQGWPVQVCDLDAGKVRAMKALGAQGRSDPAGVAAGCQALIVCVVDAIQADQVLFGPLGAAKVMGPGQAVLLCPTIAPQDVEDIARRLTERGIGAIDAPMSGGPARARDGTMSLMVACADAEFERRRELIEALSSKVFRISERPGDGARTKLVNNLLAGINLAGAAEAMAMAQRMGLRLDKTLDVIEQSSGQSWIGSDRMRRAIAGDYEPRAHVTLLQKDTRLAVEAALAAGFEAQLGPVARDLFARAAQAGLADLDDAALFRLMSQ
ncbi:NAD(P)-dependent oxidoreductase [Caenimonas soli]|jgi:3-hydroxyisobutyrate dehydrogenase|uniref:NAD(P)-dependent oxidoreductase n=1 Tax=Caenimonas soli TaxID=2735555 RepID=UPI0015567C28|nr:NAD(P)-dependent oxidoreductase [Caenimonas soli]NPC56098.1 NAD(P)-dependent oxidoreductase [Caenimonas soli]